MATKGKPSTSRTARAGPRGAATTQAPEGGRPISSTRRAAFNTPGMSNADSTKVAKVLQLQLVALTDLSLTLKHIHWNVVGPSFIGVHQMLDPQYAAVAEMVDALAERIATLGGVPSGLPGALVATRTWDDYALGRADTQAHLAALDLVYQGVVGAHRTSIAAVDDVDPVSGDLLITQTGALEQFHWFVRTHLEDWAGGMANAGATTELGAAEAAVHREGRSAAGRRRAH